MIALYPGAYKPPHRGHFEVVKALLNGSHGGHVYDKETAADAGQKALARETNRIEKIDKVLVFIGGGERNGITKEESKAIWDIYAKHLPGVEIVDGQKNPMFAAKDYAKENPKERFYAITGVRDESDFKDLGRITTFKNTPNVQGLAIPSAKGAGVRATDLRQAVLDGSLDDIRDFFPKELSRQELLTILKMLKDNIIAELLEQKLEGIFNDMFITENIDESSSGAPITPKSAVRSEDREKLAKLYEYIKQIVPPDAYVQFQQDRIQISYERPFPYDGKTIYEGADSSELTKHIASLIEYMMDEGMKITPIPEIKIKRDAENAKDFFGKTAYYDPNAKEVVLYVEGRHMKDICRSFTHEMVHHMQNLEGRLGDITTSNTNEDGNLLELEKEAYLTGNITFRNWEDKIKNSEKKSLNEDASYDGYEELASKLAEDLTRTFQEHSQTSKKPFRIEDLIEDEINGVPFVFDLDVVLGYDKNIDDIEGQAYASSDPEEDDEYYERDNDLIEVDIKINPRLKKGLEIMELTLFQFLVHEMEHLIHGTGVNRISEKFIEEDPKIRTLINMGMLPAYQYPLLPREVAAATREFAARAKATGNTFSEELNAELAKQDFKEEEKETIRKAFREYIKKHNLDLEL